MSDDPYSVPKAPAAVISDVAGRASRKGAWFDLFASGLFALFFCLFIYEARRAADEAVRLYGHNVDSGAYLWVFAFLYLVPAVLALAAAAALQFAGLRFSRVAHWLAWLWVASPFLIAAATLVWSMAAV